MLVAIVVLPQPPLAFAIIIRIGAVLLTTRTDVDAGCDVSVSVTDMVL
tara:strand:- start:440 stop:583 length:144 start_codon:yes stop_codon:yes gene_type:complete